MAIGNLARPLALIPAGASLVIFLLAHLSIGASHYDDLRAPIAKATTFEMYLRQNFTFQLVDNWWTMGMARWSSFTLHPLLARLILTTKKIRPKQRRQH